MKKRSILASTLLTALASAELPQWDPAAETAVLYNLSSAESAQLAEEYAKGRHIPQQQLIGLRLPEKEVLSRQEFTDTLVKPLAQAFLSQGWFTADMREVKELTSGQVKRMLTVTAQKIRVLVLLRGVPLKVQRLTANPQPAREDEASVDSELACLGLPVEGLSGFVKSPYFGKQQRFPSVPEALGMLLVARLDAPNAATVRRMMQDSLEAESTGLLGRAVVDLAQKKGAYQQGETWLTQSAAALQKAGMPVLVDRQADVLPSGFPLPDTAFYLGWYTGDASGALADAGFRFWPGAVACHLHSFSASTLRSTQQNWCGPLLEQGAAATLGNVWEPYLAYTAHFSAFTEMLLSGYTLGEAAWAATPVLSWMSVVVGDPLYRPFATQSMGDERQREYALYRALVEKHRSTEHRAAFKEAIVKLASTRNSARLLESLALLARTEGRSAEAAELFSHARTIHTAAEDRLRTAIYEVETLRHSGVPELQGQAKALAEQTLSSLAEGSAQDAERALLRNQE